MEQIKAFFEPSHNQTQLSQIYLQCIIKISSLTVHAFIDNCLRINFKNFDCQQIYNFKQQNLIYPHFNQKKVASISLYSVSDYLNISGSENSINKLYEQLSRIFSHKGFNQFYKPIKRLGRGTFATVYLVEHRHTGVKRAAKVFSKQGQKIEYKGKEALQNQIKTIRDINHPNLIKYDGVYQTEALIYLVTQYLGGGTLQDTLKNKANLSGNLIQDVIRDILSGLAYLDENHIMHRDIKPQNVILRVEDNKWVIGDFGLAAKSDGEYLYDKCGTMGYIAPEIMDLQQNQKYAQSCDTYSLGVIAYQLIVGELPFKVQSINFFDKKLIWLLFDRQQCKNINPFVLDFLNKLLDKNPETRITPRQALLSPFFTDEKVVGQLYAFHERKKQARYERILKMANPN